jgi:predicted ATP-dependent protease
VAVTGSIDQFGNIQPVGGVTEKVEGFFDVCREVGLSGTQGVILPASNVVNLTLRPDVVAAAAAGKFHLWPVKRVEQGLELLTGMPAGVLREDGTYPPGTLFWQVADALAKMQRHAVPDDADGEHH